MKPGSPRYSARHLFRAYTPPRTRRNCLPCESDPDDLLKTLGPALVPRGSDGLDNLGHGQLALARECPWFTVSPTSDGNSVGLPDRPLALLRHSVGGAQPPNQVPCGQEAHEASFIVGHRQAVNLVFPEQIRGLEDGGAGGD